MCFVQTKQVQLTISSKRVVLCDPHDVEELAMIIKQTGEHIDVIRVGQEATSEHVCEEFGIQRSAKAFLVTMKSVRKEQP